MTITDETHAHDEYERRRFRAGVAQATNLSPPAEIRRLPHEVVSTFIQHAEEYLTIGPLRQLVLAFTAGAFVTFGALLSVVLSTGVDGGFGELLYGLGFVAGFAMVIISGAALFTEINVLLPEILLQRRGRVGTRLWRFWALVLIGNAAGALFVGAMLTAADTVGPDHAARLAEINAGKLRFVDDGVRGWFQVVASAVLGNWLVGMAAFLATAARTVSSKIVGIVFPIITFVALGLQHTPANFGYFSIGLFSGNLDGTWNDVVVRTLVPAALGNVLGGAVLVGLLFWYTSSGTPRRAA